MPRCYPNWCAAYVNGVTTWEEGRCDPTICIDSTFLISMGGPCSDIPGPNVCGCDGITYPDACYALRAGVTSWTIGQCETCINPSQIDPNMGCPDVWDPVCGCDNVTYSNSCDAYNHAGVTSWTIGVCCIDSSQMDMPPPSCINIYEPVCGCDIQIGAQPM